MNINIEPAALLDNPEVRRYFLEILRSQELDEVKKYEKFIEFFRQEARLRSEIENTVSTLGLPEKLDSSAVSKIVSGAGQKAGVWKPAEVLKATEGSIRKAIGTLTRHQRDDGGWGGEKSTIWETAFALLFLNSARRVKKVAVDFQSRGCDAAIERGVNWLKENDGIWTPSEKRSKSVYEMALITRCFYELGREDFPGVGKAWKMMISSQNEDGGWDTDIPVIETGKHMTYRGSEAGATSIVMEAIAATSRSGAKFTPDTRRQALLRGARWLVASQNPDGSWVDVNFNAEAGKTRPEPSLNKTCDALRGILSARAFNVDVKAWQANINAAVDWILDQERLITSRDMAGRWGWISSEDLRDLEGSTLSLEALVKVDDIPLPLLTTCAQWLMKYQHNESNKNCGAWEFGFTQRISLALVEFYERIASSSLFEPSEGVV